MTRLTRSDIKRFSTLNDAQLIAWWERIGSDPDFRVKAGPNKGHILMRYLRQADLVLAEIHRRRRLAEALIPAI